MVPSNTAFYELALGCDQNGNCKDNNVTRIWNNYGPNTQLVNRFQIIQNFMMVPYFSELLGIEVVAFYNLTTTSFMNTMFSGFFASEFQYISEVFVPYVDAKKNLQTLFVSLPFGYLSQTKYNPLLFLNCTDDNFIIEELLLNVDSIYIEKTFVRLPVTNYECHGIF